MTNLFFGSFFLPKPKKCDKWHGTARHGIMKSVKLVFSMKKLLLTIGRKIDHFYFHLLTIHGQFKGKYLPYRILLRILGKLFSLSQVPVPGLKHIRLGGSILTFLMLRTVVHDVSWLTFIVSSIASFWLADRTVSFFCRFRWFRRIIGE